MSSSAKKSVKKIKDNDKMNKLKARLESLSVPVSPDVANDNVLGFIKRSASAPGTDHLKRILNGGSNVETPGPIVTVPEVCDEDFHSFFPDYTPQTNKLDTQDIDFEHISTNSSRLLVSARKVRVQRKHHSANPLRALAQRNDLTTEYVEVRSGIAEKERIRLNIDKLSKANPGLAVEALAGLASREELTSVVLRRSAETGPVKQVAQWSHPLLLRTKGRRHPITSIVTPHYTSINQGDAFTLVTSNQVFCWTGEYCNVIEKSRCSEVSSEIQNRRDMGCLSASKVFNLDGTLNSPHHNTFWNILKLPQDQLDSYKGEEAGHPDEDELYESAVSQSYRVYELSDMKLIPVEQAWARHPRVQVLSSSKVMVFDFVTEIFCWCGKGSSTSERKQGLKLATELSKEPSWSQCGIQWLDDEIAANKPNVYSVTQHMEPILFREKFTDWPDFNRNNISSKGEFTNNNSCGDNAKTCDIKSMLEWSLPQPDLILENSHLGRANRYFDIETRRFYKVSTQSVRIWKIEDYAPVEVEEEEYGHFSDSHSYIIQWKYTLTVTGRELSGEPSKHLALGRDRTCFWTWQGKHAGLEAGTASLLSVGMQQGAPQVTVKEGLEPPSLQSLMPTPALVIHSEKLTKFPKLYLIEPGQDPSGDESPLIRQIACDDTNLRSAASLLYIPRATSPTVYVWHGCSTKPYYRSVCKDAVCKVLEKPSPKFKLTEDRIEISEIMEGNEPKEFFNGVVLRKGYCSEYYTKSDNSTEREVRLKLFELSVVKGVYTAVPVPPQRFNPENQLSETYRYVYSQEELYNTTSQCVVMDASPGSLWLWLKSSSPVPSAQALATCLAYAKAKDIDSQHIYVTCQGSEPTEFRALFAWWSEDLSWERGQGWSRQESRLCTDMMSNS